MAADGGRRAADRAELPAGSDSGLRAVDTAAAAPARCCGSAEARALVAAAQGREATVDETTVDETTVDETTVDETTVPSSYLPSFHLPSVFSLQRSYEVRDRGRRQRHQADAAAGRELHRDLGDGLVVRTLHDA